MIYDGIIEGISVYLKSATLEDAHFTFDLRQDAEKTKYIHKINGTVEDQKKWIEEQMARDGDYFMVVYRKNGERIGTVSIYNINSETKQGETGRTLIVGNPIEALEAIYLSYEFAYNNLCLNSLVSDVLEENTKVISLNKRLGSVQDRVEYNDEFKMKEIWFLNKKESYLNVRDKIKANVERFSSRISGV